MAGEGTHTDSMYGCIGTLSKFHVSCATASMASYPRNQQTLIIIPTARFAPLPNTGKNDHLTKKPALLNTCKRTKEEATPNYYAANTFHGQITDTVFIASFNWIASLSREESRAVKEVIVQYCPSTAAKAVCENVVSTLVLLGVQDPALMSCTLLLPTFRESFLEVLQALGRTNEQTEFDVSRLKWGAHIAESLSAAEQMWYRGLIHFSQ
ncbi:hypothetical protein BAUCODRAFT_205732 [Baudoinia panamericana UAMH 10762]|uniref:Uncharacterized protein n=1 Tax=Baudoinia panamericana (strain UAMH 10762) TaxID=717646 RepID=M2N418_BAUPA|nr:uncharacterized protein BAUCODRAFT_205732 [Baudoinia panamericana UAMH 10762]EMC93764.1 hypothetical protein BAUCODRAFT_205732 [Baudoinia panamericana UAMH 10762]